VLNSSVELGKNNGMMKSLGMVGIVGLSCIKGMRLEKQPSKDIIETIIHWMFE